jgi:predicted permease
VARRADRSGDHLEERLKPVASDRRSDLERPRLEDEVASELEFHLEMRTRELIAQGMDPDRAAREARRRLGNLGAMRATLTKLGKERNRTMDRRESVAEFRQDVRYAVRSLRTNPGFAATALVTIALGIGATTAIFSAVYSVMLRPLPFFEPERVLVVAERDSDSRGRGSDVSVGNYADLKREQTRFSTLAASYSINVNLADGSTPERVEGARVTGDYFSVFGLAPIAGRVFSTEEDRAGGPAVVVLSHRLWTRRFGGDRTVIGRTIGLNGVGHVVIGVMPAAFDFTRSSEELWLPAAFTAAQIAEHDSHFMWLVGRLRPGATQAEAAAEVDRIFARLARLYPNANGTLTGGYVERMLDQFVGSAGNRLLILLGAVGFVLVIGCVNVANLLLARGAARQKELAVRAALGAGRGRIVRQLFTESLVLAAGAGGLGIALAFGALRLLIAAAPTSVPRLDQAAIDGPALGFALGISVLSAGLFGLVPALKTAVPTLHAFLREGGRGSTAGQREWLRRGLIAAEVAIALVLLVGAGLLIRTAINLDRTDPGFDPRGVLSVRLTLPAAQYGAPELVSATFGRIVLEASREPGIQAVGLSSQVPAGPGGSSNGLVPEGRPLEPASSIDTRLRLVTPGYLGTLRIPLRAGRDFTADDRADRRRVVIVNEAFTRVAWPGERNPVGKRVACCDPTDPWKEVVGVVADVRWRGPSREVSPEFYLPVEQAPNDAWNWLQRSMTLVARGNGGPDALLRSIREAVRRVDPALPLYGSSTMDERLAGSIAEARFNTNLLGLLGAIGLLLSAVGIYGVIAYFVSRRTRELGIRMALGASAAKVGALVVRQGLGPVTVGIAAGLVLAAGLARLLTSQLSGVSAGDPLTYGVVALILLVVAILASLVPAVRATRVDSASAMREE